MEQVHVHLRVQGFFCICNHCEKMLTVNRGNQLGVTGPELCGENIMDWTTA